jgi:TP901 family phage tail tape measure protein
MMDMFKLQAIIEMVDKCSGPTEKIKEHFKGLEAVASRGQTMIDYGNKMSLAGNLMDETGKKMRGIVQDIMAPTIAFEASAAPLETVIPSTLGSVAKSMNMAKKAALDWSSAHADSTDNFLMMSYRMVSAGYNDKQALDSTRISLRVAKAALAKDVPATGALLSTLYNNLGDKSKNFAKEFARVGDVVVKTQQYFQFDSLDTLAEGLKYGTPAAMQYGMSLEELATIIGQLNNAGLAGGMAGTAFSATMRQLIKGSRELGFEIDRDSKGNVSLIGTLGKMRSKFGDLTKLTDTQRLKFQEAFGDEGLRAIMLLQGKVGDMNDAMKRVKNSTGAAANAQRIIEQKTGQQLQIAQQQYEALNIIIGTQLLPSLNKILPVVSGIIQGLGDFAEKHPFIIKMVFGFIALAGAIFGVVAPIMMVKGSIGTLIGYSLKGYASIAKFSSIVILFVKSGGLIQLASGFWTACTATWAWTVALLANPITWIVLGIVALIAAIIILAMNWKKVSAWLGSVWANVVKGFKNFLNWLKTSPIGQTISWLLAVFMPFIGIPLLIYQNWGKIAAFFSSLFSDIGNFFGGFITAAFEWGGNLIGGFIEGIQSKVKELKQSLFNTADQIKNFLGFHSPTKLGPGSGSNKWAPALMTMYATGITKGTKGVKHAALGAADEISNALSFPDTKPPTSGTSRPMSFNSNPIPPLTFDKDTSGDNGRIVFKGPFHIVIEKCDSPEDFADGMMRWAEEVGV